MNLSAIQKIIRGTQPASILLALRVIPRGGAARIDGFGRDAEGRSFLKLRVNEVAEKGKANEAVIKLLAKEWQLARSSLTIVSGTHDRSKLLEIRGDPAALCESIALWCGKAGIATDRTEDADE